MSLIEYGFIDDNNLLLETAVFENNNQELIEHAQTIFGASSYHVLNSPFGPAVIKSSIWTGDYFTPGCNYKTWTWNSQEEKWVSPIPEPENNKSYYWSDEEVNWIEVI